MVSTSTRRLPSTWIEDTDWATAGDAITTVANVAATGTANMIRAAKRPPRTRIPTFMRNAPSSFQCRTVPLRTSRFPFVAILVANFARAANARLQCNFNFIPRRCLLATLPKKASQPRHLMEIIVKGEHHQHQHQGKADAEPVFLRLVRQGTPSQDLRAIEQKVTTVEKRHRKQVEQSNRNGKHRGKVKQRGESQRRHLTGDLSDSNRATDLVGTGSPRKDIPYVGERLIHHEPGFLDAQPECGGGVDLLGRHFAGRCRTGDSHHALLMGVAERVFHWLEFRRSAQFQRRIAAFDPEGQLIPGVSHDNSLHIGKASDRAAIDRDYDVTDLKAGFLGGAAHFHLVDARRRARLAKEGEQAGKDHDGQNEIGDWTGGHDRRTRSNFLVVETALSFLFGHAGERFGGWR